MSALTAMLGLPPDALPIVLACGVVIFTLLGWMLSKPDIPPKPSPCGVLDADGVLWRSDSVGAFVSVPEEGITNVWAAVERSVKRFPHKQSIGQRPLLSRAMVADPANPARSFEKLSFGAYEWMSFAEYHARVVDFAGGLVAFTGLQPKGRLVVYGETQRDWMVAALAAFRQNVAVVTIYATLGEDGVVHGINQTKATAVVADAKLLHVLVGVAKHCATLKTVISISPDVSADDRAALALLGVRVKTMDECIADGRAKPVAAAAVAPYDAAVIMYTSGTTGMPKGVIITHANFVAGVAGVKQWVGHFLNERDVFLAYLPLAHIMEMMVEVTLMFFGVAIGYGSPHTLTDTGVKLAKGQQGDAPLLKPTLMVFAPAVLDKVFQGVKQKVAAASPLAQKLFGFGLAAGSARFERGQIGAGRAWNALVFKKVQALLGGKVRAMITGSAPLAPDVQRFVQTVFNCPVRQGYGLTETCAASVLTHLGDNTPSSVGAPSACACVRLRDWAEGGYLVSDKSKAGVNMPRGEVLIGGPMVTAGYLLDPASPDPEVSAKNESEYVTLKGVRYFCSGDIGQIDADGNLQIIDRKKDLVKLQQGEYVALSKVENALKGSAFVDLPMVYAKSTEYSCIALVCPAAAPIRALASSLGLGAEATMEAICASKEVLREVSKSCLAACKAANLVGFEIPKAIGLVAETWTPENNMLTAAMKLKRTDIVARHKAELETLYK